jgi:hypothetical protein
MTTPTAILILGGGPPTSLSTPPVYVKPRIETALAIYQQSPPSSKPKLICLSAGTAHVKSLTTFENDNNCPPQIIYESTSCASLILELSAASTPIDSTPFEKKDLFLETTSYDTVGNAYYSRLLHFDSNPRMFGKDILIITSDFHMQRSKEIFNFVFSLPSSVGEPAPDYRLNYVSTPSTTNQSLSKGAINARLEKEEKSLRYFRAEVVAKVKSLEEMHEFMAFDHQLYSVKGLVERSTCDDEISSGGEGGGGGDGASSDPSILESYGGGGQKQKKKDEDEVVQQPKKSGWNGAIDTFKSATSDRLRKTGTISDKEERHPRERQDFAQRLGLGGREQQLAVYGLCFVAFFVLFGVVKRRTKKSEKRVSVKTK